MLRFYAADEVHAALDYAQLVDALERAFAAGANVPLRHVHQLDAADRLLLMPAWGADDLGVKLVTVMPGNKSRGAATVHGLYVLLDRASGKPRALLDGEALTVRRTAAASALAARHLARADSDTLLVIGTGGLAPFMACAHHALRPQLRRVVVWGRDSDRTQALAQSLRQQGLPAVAATDLQLAVREAHIISCATTATTPIVCGDWLAPGTHLDLVGGFTPAMREVDDAAIARARIVVDTYAGALAEAGDVVAPLAAGVISRDRVVAELAELVRGTAHGRTNEREITVFKSVGTALEDLAAAALVVAAAP